MKAFRLLVNRSATWADWDEGLLALDLAEIKTCDFDLALTGFGPPEIDNLLFQLHVIPGRTRYASFDA